MKRKLNLQFFADPTNTDHTGGEPAAEPQKTVTEPPVKEPEVKTVPYDRFKEVNDTLKTFKETFQSLGIEGVDKLKELVDGYSSLKKAEDERKKAEMDIQDRLKLEKEEAEKRALEKEQHAQTAMEKANARLLKAEFRLIAKELGVRADALEDAFVLADKSSIKVDDEGTVEGVKEAVEALIQAKPFLAEQPKKEPKQIGNPSNPPSDGTQKTSEQLIKEAYDKMRKTGRMEDRVAYATLKRELGL